jgi:hypothetical protein
VAVRGACGRLKPVYILPVCVTFYWAPGGAAFSASRGAIGRLKPAYILSAGVTFAGRRAGVTFPLKQHRAGLLFLRPAARTAG